MMKTVVATLLGLVVSVIVAMFGAPKWASVGFGIVCSLIAIGPFPETEKK